MNKRNQYGFSVVEAFIILVVLGLIGLVGFKVVGNKKGNNNNSNSSSSQEATTASGEAVKWSFNHQAHKWEVVSGEAPDCPDPLFSQSPTDVSQTSSVLWPGQYRNKDYKAHGGLGFNPPNPTQHEVFMPFDATLTGLVRYTELGELQYLVEFLHPCGIAIRFDHLRDLTPDLMAIAETTPAPKADDTRAAPLERTISLKAGDKVATSVGFTVFESAGFDFGVYDYRKRNNMATNDTWRQLHEQYSAQHWYGVCWFDLLPSKDATHVKALKPINPSAPPEVSDYCPGAPGGTTLDHNGGKPE